MPGITDGLFAARAGIQSHGIGISVLSDNIANLNTTGFKQSRPDFADILAGSLGGGGGSRAGSGSSISVISQILTQGTFEQTGRGLDAGIDGRGFFVLKDVNGSGQTAYSRAGNFSTDSDGNIINQNGYQVQGFPANGAGGLGALNVNQISQDTVITNNIRIGANLNAGATTTVIPGGIPATGSPFASFATASDFSTFVDVFDSLGQPHTVTAYFYHDSATPNTWSYQAVVPAEDTGGVAGNATVIGTGTLAFDTAGLPVGATNTTLTVSFSNGSAPNQAIALDFTPVTQYFSPSAANSIFQDGTGVGSVVGFSIDETGTLLANLSNGQSATIGTLALANFANPEALQRAGSSLFTESANAGEAVIGEPGSGPFGKIESGALELSTADLANDFVKLISLQRGFQGSSRIITNINDLLNELINLA